MAELKIGYLSDMPPLDGDMHSASYSGGNARIFEALKGHARTMSILPQDWGGLEPVRRLILASPETVNLRVRFRAHYALRQLIARRVERAVKEEGVDVVFGAYALHAMAGLRVPPHVVLAFTSDAVQTVYRTSEIGQAHPRKLPLGRWLDGWLERQERAALHRLDLALWPSEWLKDAVDARYGLRPDVGHIVPWGANVPWIPSPPVKTLAPSRPVQLLIIGRDWFAKGGPLAFDTMQALRAKGIDARLTVIGCQPPDAHRDAHVTVHTRLNKSLDAEMEVFERALNDAHFLVQPSFESYGFAFCEASAYGLPALGLRVGGVPLRDGANGHAVPVGSGAETFSDLIVGYLAEPERYSDLSRSSREEYETRLNWTAWGEETAMHMREAAARKRASPTNH